MSVDCGLQILEQVLKYQYNPSGEDLKVSSSNQNPTENDNNEAPSGVDFRVLSLNNPEANENDEPPSFVRDYKLHFALLFLDKIPYIMSGTQLRFKTGKGSDLVFKHGNETQQEAVLKALMALEGLACIQGPPATGKTTTAAVLTVNAVEMLDPAGGTIVCDAQTNEAVYVLAARVREKLAEHYGND